jgi:hypothetical protein
MHVNKKEMKTEPGIKQQKDQMQPCSFHSQFTPEGNAFEL